MGRMVGGRKRGAAIVGVALVAVALVSGCGGSHRAAVPVPQTIGAPSPDVPGLKPTRSQPRLVAAVKSVHAKPHQLYLTRAHSAVFDVRKLKSVVVKKERPELEDPIGASDDEAGALSENRDAGMPSKLEKSDMVQKASGTANTVTPGSDASFDGLDFANWGGGHPPDENGDVGPTYYIQTVNTSIGIYDKSNGNRVAAFTFNTFMSQGSFGNLCDTDNFGDPVVLYDSYENRWMITDFAFKLSGGNFVAPAYECFAVSKTGDPVSGGWNFYSIQSPGALNDYPKFGVWPDGLYMSANMFSFGSGAYQGFHVWALNKQQMYANAPQVSVVDFSGGPGDFTVIPANSKLAAGTPPAGSPEYFVSTWNLLDAVQIYKFHVDWDKISTSTFTGPFNQFAPNCWPAASVGNASTPANSADTLQIRAMATPQYTNLGGAESVWVAHTVQRGTFTGGSCGTAASNNATIRWYQANVTGGTIAANVTQGSSFDPEGANTYFRFQPALAVDRSGDMAVTYTKSNAATNPLIMYDGRLAGDPSNTLGTENTLIAGTGAQSGTCGPSTCTRWGDYAGMQLDPDGCHFWMTGEYYATTGLNDLTRIGSFHYPGCTPVGNGTLSGTVTDGANPISGATITLGSRTTTTNGSGFYSFSVPAGTYPSLTADSPGYTQGSASSLAVPSGGTLTKNFTLSGAPQAGCVTDNSQSLFQRGVPSSGCDLTTNPGSVQLSALDNTEAQNPTVTGNGFGFDNTNWAGQTFTPTVSGKLKRVDVELFCYACSAAGPNITLSIRATSGATPVPTGSDLASATIAGFNDGAAGGLHTFTFSTPLQVTAGTRYAFVFRNVAPFASGTMAYTCSCSADSNPYADGQFVTSSNSGAAWLPDTTAGGRDLNFVTYINPGYTSGTFVSSIRDANPAPGGTPHWTTLSFVDTTPANTAVKFQVAASNSQNGPWNYVGPDGTGSTFFTASGASLSQFDGKRYLRYEAILTSSDPTATPSLSSVQTCFADAPVATTLSVAPASGRVGGRTTLSAILVGGATGVAGKTVSFKLHGASVGGATTDANGVARLLNVNLTGISAGSYPTGVSASFAGDATYEASTGSSSLLVFKSAGIIGLNSVSVATSSGTIDSFNSSSGAYGPSNHGSAALVVSNGPLSFAGVSVLGSTISTEGAVSLSHTASVSGNLTAGTTASVLGTVGGAVTQHAPSTAVSPPTVSKCRKLSRKTGIRGGKFRYSPKTGNLVVKHGTVKLAAKTYCFNNVTLAAGSTLSVHAQVTIHLRGKLTGKGQIANTTNLPGKLHIDTSYAGAGGVAMVGGTHAAMTLVAPKTGVTITGGSFFGTVLGLTVKLTGGIQFHADMH